jgi:hypothetical protein
MVIFEGDLAHGKLDLGHGSLDLGRVLAGVYHPSSWPSLVLRVWRGVHSSSQVFRAKANYSVVPLAAFHIFHCRSFHGAMHKSTVINIGLSNLDMFIGVDSISQCFRMRLQRALGEKVSESF